jgi:hypothetical protein
MHRRQEARPDMPVIIYCLLHIYCTWEFFPSSASSTAQALEDCPGMNGWEEKRFRVSGSFGSLTETVRALGRKGGGGKRRVIDCTAPLYTVLREVFSIPEARYAHLVFSSMEVFRRISYGFTSVIQHALSAVCAKRVKPAHEL